MFYADTENMKYVAYWLIIVNWLTRKYLINVSNK